MFSEAALDSAPHFGANVKASLSIPSFGNNFDAEQGVLTNQELSESMLTAFKVTH